MTAQKNPAQAIRNQGREHAEKLEIPRLPKQMGDTHCYRNK